MAERLLPFWNGVTSREGNRRFMADSLRAAAALDSPELAASLLQPLTLDRLTLDAAPGCIAMGLNGRGRGYGLSIAHERP